jgi:hypothetical protein
MRVPVRMKDTNRDTADYNRNPAPASNNLLVAAIAALATLAGAAFGAYALVSSAKLSRVESCVKRVDEREMITRKKAEDLLGDMGIFLGSFGSSGSADEIPREPAKQVIRSAFALTAYAPADLNVVALRIAATVYAGLIAHTDEQKEKAIDAARGSFSGWNKSYIEHMQSFQDERKQCSES